MKKIVLTLLIGLVMYILSSCIVEYGQTATGDIEQSSEETTNQTEAYETIVAEEDRLPTDELKISCMSNTVQLIMPDDIMANTLNAYIRMYTNSSDVILPDFDDITKITDVSVFQYIALGATPLVKADYTTDGISVRDQHPDNVIYKFIDNEAEKGNYIYDFCYIDDVCKTAAALFGNENPVLFDFNKDNINIDFGVYTTTFAIYTEVGIITTNADINYSEPQIMDYEKTDTGYICEALILPEHRMVDGVEITQDNIYHYIDKMPKYRFTFIEYRDTFVLSGLKKIT